MPEPEKNAEVPKGPTQPDAVAEPVDVRAIRHLVELMKRYDLTAIDFVEGFTPIRLRHQGHRAWIAPTLCRSRRPRTPPPALAPRPPPPRRLRPRCAVPAAPQGDLHREPDGRHLLLVSARRIGPRWWRWG